MPPKARPDCKLDGCDKLRHVYPSGSKAQYCKEHMYLRKSKYRQGFAPMTGQQKAVLNYLREQGCFATLSYPFAHGRTIKALIERDWVFESVSPHDGSVKYKITGRGLKALNAYEVDVYRNDGICPRCNERPRHVSDTGTTIAYCLECERKRNVDRRRRGAADGDTTRPCSRCGERERYQYPNGRWSSYCGHCERVRARKRMRQEQRRLLKHAAAGRPMPVCQKCKKRPRRVFPNSVSKYCDVCGPKYFRKLKLRRALKSSGLGD